MSNSVGMFSAYIKKTVFSGNPGAPFSNITAVSSGTGNAQTSGNKIGMFCIDKSSGNVFLCSATTGTGTWVSIFTGTGTV
jgi:hypothetical protein